MVFGHPQGGPAVELVKSPRWQSACSRGRWICRSKACTTTWTVSFPMTEDAGDGVTAVPAS